MVEMVMEILTYMQAQFSGMKMFIVLNLSKQNNRQNIQTIAVYNIHNYIQNKIQIQHRP